LFRGINYMGGLGWMRSSWGLWGKEEGVGQDLEQPGAARTILLWSRRWCKTLSNSLQTVLGFFSVFSSRTDTYADF
jgi:hypothetical protein